MPVAASRLYHVNVNCTDLDRSLAWYTSVLGLTPTVNTHPETPQPGAAFGLAEVQWNAWILQGAGGHDEVVLDLLQWEVPGPTGGPRSLDDPGFVALVVSAPDPPAEASPTDLVAGGALVADPDDTPVVVVAGEPGIRGLVVGCADVDASRAWYHEVVGLPLDAAGHPTDAERGFTFHLRAASGDRPPARANEVGIFRTAALTDDIDGDHRLLVEAGTTCYSPPAALRMGPGLPDLRALFFADPDGACVELIAPPTG